MYGDRENFCRGAMIGNLLHGRGKRQVGIPLQIARGDHFMPGMVGVVECEVMTPLIEGMAELRAAGKGFELVSVRTKADVMPTFLQRRHLASIRETDVGTAVA